MLIYPTRRAALLATGAALTAFAVAAAAPEAWTLGLSAFALVCALVVLDAFVSPWPSALSISYTRPETLQVGVETPILFQATFQAARAPAVESRLETNAVIDARPGDAPHHFTLAARRRGVAELVRLWTRWRGPLGLVYKQHVAPLNLSVPVLSNLAAVEKDAVKILTRELSSGSKLLLEHGEGSEFDALREFLPGMDLRSVDWKHSARHQTLLTREYRTEKNNAIIFAIDSGRLMCQPVLGGLSRLDHALNAALMMSFVSLKLGDRVGFYTFDAEPRIATGFVSGARAFGLLRALSAQVQYTDAEANYTLALNRLLAHVDRRSLVVVFTDFADSTSAALMLKNLGPLLRRHLVIFAAFRDVELEQIADAPPRKPQDLARTVIADRLLRERDLVIRKLQKMGVLTIDAPAEAIGAALVNQYLRIKKRDLL
ncbi:MAG: DUF58 domain-containing protein [Pseudomonadota bacterium]